MSTIRDELLSTGCGLEIAEDAEKHGYTPTLIRDNGKLGDHRMALFQCGDVLAITTNGPTIWDTSDRETWEEAMSALDA